jgi:DNA-binding winged helix-turn-helix (wHTH) protein
LLHVCADAERPVRGRGPALSVAFGEFELDAEARQLRKGRAALQLSPKAFELLVLLVAGAPKALSKEALRERLWPDTFVVEANLANLVGEIRAALGDDPRRPRFVRTVHRFGYAFQDQAARASGAPVLYRLTWKAGRALLGEGEHVLGRDPELPVCLEASSVSRRHALIRVSRDGAVLEDLGSKNGTLLDGRRISGPANLGERAEIRVGPFKLALRAMREAAASTKTAASND